MDRGRSEIWINAAPEEVYRHLADFRLHPRWRPQLSVEPTPTRPAAVGDTFETRGRHPERHRQNRETVTRLVPDEIVEFEGVDQRLGTFHHGFRLEATGRGTHVVRTVAVDFRWRVLELLRPLVYRTLVPHMLGRDLVALKECIEADVHVRRRVHPIEPR